MFSSLGNGETTTVPNCAKFSGVRGSGVRVAVGLVERIGAMVGFLVLRCVWVCMCWSVTWRPPRSSVQVYNSMRVRGRKEETLDWMWFMKLMRRCRRPPVIRDKRPGPGKYRIPRFVQ